MQTKGRVAAKFDRSTLISSTAVDTNSLT